jgi:hypothetical protein
VKWAVIDRARWVEANIEGMTRLLAPLADRLSERLDALPLPVRLAQRVMISTEAGVLLGYVSRRVLGQYDLLVRLDRPADAAAAPSPLRGETRHMTSMRPATRPATSPRGHATRRWPCSASYGPTRPPRRLWCRPRERSHRGAHSSSSGRRGCVPPTCRNTTGSRS